MQSRAAIRYAKAMYDISNEENFINAVYKDMSLIKNLYGDSLDFKNLLSNSQINHQNKKKAILSLLENSDGYSFLNSLYLFIRLSYSLSESNGSSF